MQSKKRISRTLVFVTVLSITILFFSVSCNGRWAKAEQNQGQGNTSPEQDLSTFPKIDDEWVKSDPKFVFESKSLQEFLKAKKITQITFLSADGLAYPLRLEEFEATAIIPCADFTQVRQNYDQKA